MKSQEIAQKLDELKALIRDPNTCKDLVTSLSADELIDYSKMSFQMTENGIKVSNTDWLRVDKIIEVIDNQYNQPQDTLDITEVYSAGKAVPELTAGKADGLPAEFLPEPVVEEPVSQFPYDPDENIVVGDSTNDWGAYNV